MTVKEMRELIEDEHTFVLIDNVSGVQVFSEAEANNSNNPNVVATRWKQLEKYSECEVIGLRANSDSEVAFYIDAPTRHFKTWLDVEYSITIELDVPYGEDENKVLAEYARQKLDALPNSFTIGADQWEYSFDNLDGGSFFGCIEER